MGRWCTVCGVRCRGSRPQPRLPSRSVLGDGRCDTRGERVLYEITDPLGKMRLIQLENSTPERDTGATKRYTFRVPPTIATCREAVSWMYGLKPAAYAPVLES